jgi:hypothetical protein
MMTARDPSSPDTTGTPRTCWVVTDGAAGAENQCIALAEALGCEPTIKRIQARAPWRWLPPELWPNPLAALSGEGDTLRAPWPDLVIGSSRKAAAPVAAIGRSSPRTFTAFVQDPRMPLDAFDAVVAPNHDGLVGEGVFSTVGGLSRVTPSRLETARQQFRTTVADLPGPRIAVLVGGRSHAYDLSATRARRLGQDVADMCARSGGGAMVTTSRRTPAAAAEELRSVLRGQPALVWQPGRDPEPNPYFGFLAWADYILVTADSVSMLSEAASTGKPIQIVPMDGGRGKFERFHRELIHHGIAKPFDGTLDDWTYEPLAEARRVAEALKPRIAAKLGGPAAPASPAAALASA